MSQQERPDPMEVDQRSGVKHADVLSQAEAQEILSKTWDPMVETETHLVVRRMHDGPDEPVEGVVIVARGEAARLLSEFTHTIPSFREED
jgi:hypothetical protein